MYLKLILMCIVVCFLNSVAFLRFDYLFFIARIGNLMRDKNAMHLLEVKYNYYLCVSWQSSHFFSLLLSATQIMKTMETTLDANTIHNQTSNIVTAPCKGSQFIINEILKAGSEPWRMQYSEVPQFLNHHFAWEFH